MRLKSNTARDLFDTMVSACEDEIQGIGNGNCVEYLAEILYEDYPTWRPKKCKTTAEQFFNEYYAEAFNEAQETFEPTALQEAISDIRREAIYGR